MVSCIKILPNLYEFGNNIDSNIRQWARVWMIESCPPQEEVEKVEIRIEKVSHQLKEGQNRIMIHDPESPEIDLDEGELSTPTSTSSKKKSAQRKSEAPKSGSFTDGFKFFNPQRPTSAINPGTTTKSSR